MLEKFSLCVEFLLLNPMYVMVIKILGCYIDSSVSFDKIYFQEFIPEISVLSYYYKYACNSLIESLVLVASVVMFLFFFNIFKALSSYICLSIYLSTYLVIYQSIICFFCLKVSC